MLISHKHHFIFVKTRKTGSTSVEIALSRFCDGNWDVVTPVSARDRPLQERVGVHPKNYMIDKGNRLFPGHASAAQIQNIIGKHNWSAFSTICVVRNPWDRVFSQYRYRNRNRVAAIPSFADFVREEMFTDEFPMYHAKNRRLVDHILRFESLQNDFAKLMCILNLDWDGWLPHANVGDRPSGSHYSSYYTPELVEIVARKCAREIKLFGYQFEQPCGFVTKAAAGSKRNGPDAGRALETLPDFRAMDVNVLAGNHCRPGRDSRFRAIWHNKKLFLKNTEDATAYRLSPSAERIWRLCDGTLTVEKIYDQLARSMDAPPALLSTDVLLVLDNMKTQGQLIAPDLHATAGKMTNVVDLRKVGILVITAGDPARKRFMTGQLEALGLDFDFVDAVPHENKRISIAMSHLKALALDGVRLPLLVLEDDCRFKENIPYEYELPAATDALYLGVSSFGSKIPGRLSRARWGGVRYVLYSPDYFRVYNMLARHAVLFVSERFRSSVVECVKMGIQGLGAMFPGDAYYAMLHASHQVLTPVETICFQDREFGGVESATRISLCDATTRITPG